MLKIKKPKFKEILPRIFLLTFDNQFDLAMTFCRFQEYYESPDLKGKRFTFAELMRYYAMKWGKPKGSFSYTEDWNGFNIPGPVIRNCLIDNFEKEPVSGDWVTYYTHEYDELMVEYLKKILRKNKDWNFYLIGIHTGEGVAVRNELIAHESAHGLFTTNADYRGEMQELVDNLPKRVYNHIGKVLKKVGYGDEVIDDEIHAHMTAGLRDCMNKKLLEPHRVPFKKVYRKYTRKKKK